MLLMAAPMFLDQIILVLQNAMQAALLMGSLARHVLLLPLPPHSIPSSTSLVQVFIKADHSMLHNGAETLAIISAFQAAGQGKEVKCKRKKKKKRKRKSPPR